MIAKVAGVAHGRRKAALAIATFVLLGLSACSGDDDAPTVPAPTDDTGTISLDRRSWSLASMPVDPGADGEEARAFTAGARVETTRWFMLNPPVLRRYLEPDVGGAEGQTAIPALELFLRAGNGTWGSTSWGGIMCSPTATGVGFPNMSGMAWLDIWVNDWAIDRTERTGRLHVDFGRLDEDGFWPNDEVGNPIVGSFEQEDGSLTGTPDGVFTYPEDMGLDRCGTVNGDPDCRYSADYEIAGDTPYPQINMTAQNGREDSEDIDHNGTWDRTNSYFTCVIDLATTEALIDVVRDYDDVPDLIASRLAWRLYRIPIRRSVVTVDTDGAPTLLDVRHFRLWLEDASHAEAAVRRLQVAGIRFH